MMSTRLTNKEREPDPQATERVNAILHPDTPAPEPQTEKRTRTTVGKLLARYQERVRDCELAVSGAKMDINLLEVKIADQEREKAFWLEAIAEIEGE